MTNARLPCLGFILLALTLAAGAQAQTFTKIADTATAIVGGTGNYTEFNNGSAIDASGNVAFVGYGAASQAGVYYSASAVLSRIADTSTAIPGGTGNFQFFNGSVSTTGGNVAFNAGGASDQSGIYYHNGSSATSWVDTGTAIPGGSGNFTGGVRAPYLRGTSIAFIGQNSDYSQQGIYVTDGTTTTKIVDKTTVIPGLAGSYGWSSELAFDSGNIAFAANTSPGVFTLLGGYSSGAGLVTLATTATAAPGAGVNFTSFESPPDLSGSDLFFKASFTGGSGLYTMDVAGGGIARVVDTSMAAVGSSGNFTGFGGADISGARLVFVGNFADGNALYVSDGTTATWLVGTGDLLDGRTVSSIGFGREGLNGDLLSFRASFSDSTSGIFSTQLAAIPEPSTYALMAGGLMLGVVFLRRRRSAR